MLTIVFILALNVVIGVAVNVKVPLGVPTGAALIVTLFKLFTETTVTGVVFVNPVPVITIPGTNAPVKLALFTIKVVEVELVYVAVTTLVPTVAL